MIGCWMLWLLALHVSGSSHPASEIMARKIVSKAAHAAVRMRPRGAFVILKIMKQHSPLNTRIARAVGKVLVQ